MQGMPNATIWLPKELAADAKAAGINVSRAAADGIRRALGQPELFAGSGSAECRACGRTIIPSWSHLGASDHTAAPKAGSPS